MRPKSFEQQSVRHSVVSVFRSHTKKTHARFYLNFMNEIDFSHCLKLHIDVLRERTQQCELL